MRANERRMRLIEELCERKFDTIDNLAFELGVSRRTICYDIEELSLSYPIFTAKGTGGGVWVRAQVDCRAVDCDMGFQSQSRKHCGECARVLFLLCRVVRFRHALHAGVQTRCRLAGDIRRLPLVVRRAFSVGAFRPFQKEDCAYAAPLFRGAQLRVHQRASHRVDDLRKYGQKEDHDDNGYGAVAGSNVQTAGVRDTARHGHENAVFSVDCL